MNDHTLRLGPHEARIAAAGAELQALRLEGRGVLWEAGPLWPKHAPLLFPAVGALKDGRYRLDGAAFHLPKHGFARDRVFAWTRREEACCELVLADDATTRAVYPFPFRLTVRYALTEAGLRQDLVLHNPGDQPLPASLGLHPAFRWPLAPGLPKAVHRLVFEAAEPGPLRRIDSQGLLTAAEHPSPIRGRILPLDEALFEDDALIFLSLRSRALRFEAEGGPALSLAWDGFPHLGVWTRPDRVDGFLCVEPWDGHADPAAWDGDFRQKPGSFQVEPGGTRHWSFRVGLGV